MLIDIETNNRNLIRKLSAMKKSWKRIGNNIIVDLNYPQLISLHDEFFLDAIFKIKTSGN